MKAIFNIPMISLPWSTQYQLRIYLQERLKTREQVIAWLKKGIIANPNLDIGGIPTDWEAMGNTRHGSIAWLQTGKILVWNFNGNQTQHYIALLEKE